MSFFGSLFGTDKAARAITDAQNKNIAQSQQTQQQNTALYQPYVNQGSAANTQIGNLLGFNGADAQQGAINSYSMSPDYQVRYQTGLDALDRSNLGKYGSLNNGNVLKATENYGQQQGALGYNDYYNKLAGQQGVGLQATTGTANSNQNANTAITQANTAIGNADANAALQNGSILGGILSLGTQLFAPGISSGINSLFKPNPVATTSNSSSAHYLY